MKYELFRRKEHEMRAETKFERNLFIDCGVFSVRCIFADDLKTGFHKISIISFQELYMFVQKPSGLIEKMPPFLTILSAFNPFK